MMFSRRVIAVVCPITLFLTLFLITVNPVSAHWGWGRTWNGVNDVSYFPQPQFRPFGGLFQCLFCHAFPCSCHTTWRPVEQCFDPCFDTCCDTCFATVSTGGFSSCNCNSSASAVYNTSPSMMTSPVPVLPRAASPASVSPVNNGPNYQPRSGNFNIPLIPTTGSNVVAPPRPVGYELNSTKPSIPLRNPPSSLEGVINSTNTSDPDPASTVPAIPMTTPPPTFTTPSGEEYKPSVPVPPASIPTTFPTTTTAPGVERINLGSGSISVNVPENAKIYINGYETRMTGTSRTFVSSDLVPGRDYQYEVRVVANINGRVVDETKQMLLQSNEHSLLTFSTLETSYPKTQIAARPLW